MTSDWSSDTASLLTGLLQAISSSSVKVIDLSAALDEQTPVIQLPEPFANTAGFRYQELASYDDRGPNWYWNDFYAGEHVGTHLDAPIHWISGRGLESVDTADLSSLIAEICVVDLVDKCDKDPDYLASVDDIRAFEDQYGSIPKGAWVFLRTGWDRYAADAKRFLNVGDDGNSHTPGFAPETPAFLVGERQVIGVGVETVGTDAGQAPGLDPPFPAHYYLHGGGRFGLTQLANVDKLPPRGSVLLVLPLKITGGSGSPVRPVALVGGR
jgi:kynurenine formamidase